APYKGRIYDPCCGSGGMFVQSEKFVEAHGGKLGDISIYGQESNATTRRLAMMNLAIRGIEADLGEEQADTFRRDLHPDLRADFDADLVDCMVALPGQLFYSTQIPVCLWFLSRDKTGRAISPKAPLHDRRRQTLFIDARKLGHLVDRVHRELTDEETQRIAESYHAWRGTDDALRNPHSEVREYADVPGFCKSATTDEIARHGYVLTPGRYVGAEEVEDEGEPFEEKMPRLVKELNSQFAESAKLQEAIKDNLAGLG